MLSDDDWEQLRTHRIVSFADRVIFDAEPPIDAAVLASVQERCAGPIPQPLIDLWSVTAGGLVDYDVTAFIGGANRSFSWVELFFRGASTYYDLDGWIDHELELARQSAVESGRVTRDVVEWLPIGGFEYLDRAYVRVAQDDQHGSVLVWMHGLPPTWEGYLHEDSAALFAPSLPDAFARFHLAEHPITGVGPYRRGLELLGFVETRVAQHGLAQSLAARLIEFYATTAMTSDSTG
jgi:hypothetical protein